MILDNFNFIVPLLFLLGVRLCLWPRFNNPYQHGGFLQVAVHYRDTGRLEAMYDVYPSWHKHPLQVIDYQAFFCLLGLFLRVLRVHPLRGAQTFQLLLVTTMALALYRMMPEGFGALSFLGLTVAIAPLFLSLIVTPDLMLMTATSLTLVCLQGNLTQYPMLAGFFLGLLGYAGIRIKSSGFVLSMSIVLILPLAVSGWGPCLTGIILTLLPLGLDAVRKKENMVLNLIKTQLKGFGYSLEDDAACVALPEIVQRGHVKRLKTTVKVILSGFATALNPLHQFSLFRSNGLFLPLGLVGITVGLVQNRPAIQSILIFSWVYFFLFLTFFASQRRHFHFAGRAGGTLAPICIVWVAYLGNAIGTYGLVLVWLLLILEGARSLKILWGQNEKILLEPIYRLSPGADPVIAKLKAMLGTNDLLLLTYQDLLRFGMALGAWQAVIALEKATVPIVCKYIDYYTHDKKYRHIYLVLPPGAPLFLDKERRYHYIEEPELAARFKPIDTAHDLNGYRIFEARRPTVYRELGAYEGCSPDQLKNMPIDFSALNPV